MNLKTILLADNNADYRELLCHYLHSLGYPVPAQAANGEEVLRIALMKTPDLIIMEVRLPKKNGFEVVALLRANPLTRDTIIIAATATIFPYDRAKCLRGGFSAYLAKPFTRREFNDILQSLSFDHTAPSGF